MAQLIDLLDGFTGTTPAELEMHIQNKASELKLKLFIDDGQKNIFVPKARLDAEIVKGVELKRKIAEQAEAITKVDALTKDNEKAQATIQALNTKMESLTQTMKDNTLSMALRAKAMELKAMDESGQDLLAFIDKAKLVINEDGTVTGLDEALKSLKASKGYLFHSEEPKQPPSGGTGAPGRPASNAVPGSKSAKPGDFGSMLSQQFKGSTMGINVAQQNQDNAPTYNFFK